MGGPPLLGMSPPSPLGGHARQSFGSWVCVCVYLDEEDANLHDLGEGPGDNLSLGTV